MFVLAGSEDLIVHLPGVEKALVVGAAKPGWKLVGIEDMTAVDPSKARPVPAEEAKRRMPCLP